MYQKYLKRLLDIAISLIAIIVLLPVILVIALLVRVKLGSPIIFQQDRPGKNEKIFKLYKFRSMTDERDLQGHLLPDEIRLTKFGNKLRSSSLDELPELFNVLKGDMSLIGPRPLLIEYLPYYTLEEKKRHTCLPGITGLAQISGRNYLDWDLRLKKDIEYVSSITFKGDIKIFYKTVILVLQKKDIAANTDEIEGNLADIRKANL